MPVYEYQCLECRKKFEVIETIRRHEENRKVPCPKCKKSKQVERRWSSVFVETSTKS